MKHKVDWQKKMVRCSYQKRYIRHKVEAPLPAEFVRELEKTFCSIAEFEDRYDVKTTLYWQPCHPFLGLQYGKRTVIQNHGSWLEVKFYAEPHGGLSLSVSATPKSSTTN